MTPTQKNRDTQKNLPSADVPASVPASVRVIALLCSASVAMLWLAQPPLKFWPLAFVAICPWLRVISIKAVFDRRVYMTIFVVSTGYWMLSLQGLRHANIAIYPAWIALSAYLALYHVAFILLSRRLVQRNVNIMAAAPLAWLTTELIRNYLITGISVLMLGHTMADVPPMIQVADLAGTYAVGWVLMVVNIAVYQMIAWRKSELKPRPAIAAVFVALIYLAATGIYGVYRLNQPIGRALATFVLLQRNETVEFPQPMEREREIFQNYAIQAIDAVQASKQTVDAVVWPESMFTGEAPWLVLEDDFVVPPGASVDDVMMGRDEFVAAIDRGRSYVTDRARDMGRLMASPADQPGSIRSTPPHLIAGSGVLRYGQRISSYSGVLHFDPDGHVEDWYGKTHLVMVGEYIPIVSWIPGLKKLIPPEVGLATGDGPVRMNVGDTVVSPNICIETAVERVTIKQVGNPDLPPADVVVNVTNDGWFDHSSVIDHHLRCVQLVAVGCRRPILSSANNGPTAWIDARGKVVQKLPTGSTGHIVATPTDNDRTSFYVKVGDWPIWLLTLISVTFAFRPIKSAGKP